MSTSTERSSSHSDTQMGGTQQLNDHIFLHNMPMTERNDLCYLLDQNSLWIDLAQQMGYSKKDIDQIKYESNFGSPSERLLALWSDQNHNVTELFMLLYGMQQYPAMECIRGSVSPSYHRLIVSGQPDLGALLSNRNQTLSVGTKRDNEISEKILNGPQLSREENESDVDMKSQQNGGSAIYDINNINELASAIPQIPYIELQSATINWSNSNILGRGGFGIVFKGKWKFTDVAIKRIEYHGTVADPKSIAKVQMQQSINELRYLNSCRHDNILPLYGYSIDGKEPCLVYQLMAGGSLESRIINKKTPLSLKQRLNISVGTARGLQYLHTFSKKPLIHGDIKPANILLDPCCIPKIGDFGLAREGSIDSMEVSKAYGTKPYLPKEFLFYRILSTKVDTYSFGVVLFELMTGLRAYDKGRGKDHEFLAKHIFHEQASNRIVDLIDQSLEKNERSFDIFKKLTKLGLVCTRKDPDSRPEMVDVLSTLDNSVLN